MLLPRSLRQTSHDRVIVHLFAILKLLSTVPIFQNIYQAGKISFCIKKKNKKQKYKNYILCNLCNTAQKKPQQKPVLLTHKWGGKSGKVMRVKPRLVKNVLTCNSELCDSWRCFKSLWFLKRKKNKTFFLIKSASDCPQWKKKYHFYVKPTNVVLCVCVLFFYSKWVKWCGKI